MDKPIRYHIRWTKNSNGDQCDIVAGAYSYYKDINEAYQYKTRWLGLYPKGEIIIEEVK